MDFYNTNTNQYYYPGQQFVLDGLQYPGNWLDLATTEEISSRGFVPVVYGQTVDPFYYDITEHRDGANITYTWTAKPVEPIKDDLKTRCKRAAHSALYPTDWYITRKAETGVEVPADILAARQAVRNKTDQYCSSVDAYIS